MNTTPKTFPANRKTVSVTAEQMALLLDESRLAHFALSEMAKAVISNVVLMECGCPLTRVKLKAANPNRLLRVQYGVATLMLPSVHCGCSYWEISAHAKLQKC